MQGQPGKSNESVVENPRQTNFVHFNLKVLPKKYVKFKCNAYREREQNI